MSCSTATKWLVSNREYVAAECDYAVLNAFKKLIRREIDEGNKTHQHNLPDDTPKPLYFDQILGGRRPQDCCYDFATPSRILWADVDDSKPEHEKAVRAALAEGSCPTDAENEERVALRDEVVDLVVKERIRQSKRYVDVDEEEFNWEEEVELSESNSESDDRIVIKKDKKCSRRRISHAQKAQMFHEVICDLAYSSRQGSMDPKLLSVLLGNSLEPEKKAQIIRFHTAQAFEGKDRPVMILVGMVEDMQSPNPGEKKGWAIGYDITRDIFICKPFFSDKEHHPLTGSWYGAVADDGIGFNSPAKEIVERYLELGQTLAGKLESGKIKEVARTGFEAEPDMVSDLELPEIDFAFQMAVYVVTARFILKHWAGFVDSHSDHFEEDTSELFAKAKETHRKIKRALAKIRVPAVAKVEKTDKKLCVCAVEEMEWQLEEQEDYFRKCAVMAKEQGHEKVADNTAKLYERVMEMVRSFNEDPEREI